MSALDDKITDFIDSVNKAAQYAKGDANTDVQTPSGNIPSLAKQYAQYQALLSGLTPNLNNRLRVDADGGYSAAQKAQGRANLDLGNVANVAPADLPISNLTQDAINEVGQLALSRENPVNKNANNGYVGLSGHRIVLINDVGDVQCTIATQATGQWTWNFPNKAGTVAMLSDITGTNSGNNTGDETTATIKAKLGISVLTGNNTGDETNASILSKLGLSSISGVNTGDETQQSILSKLPFALIDPATLDQAMGIAVLNANRVVEFERLPASVKNLVKVATLADLPATGNADALYLVLDDGLFYHWTGTQYGPAGTNTLGSTDQLAEGQNNLYYTDERVLEAPVALEPSNGDEVGNGDTLKTAISKLGAKDRNLAQDIAARELLSNKATDFSVINDTKYPTVQAVKTAISSAVAAALVNVVIDCGSFDATPGLYPTTGGSGAGGAVVKGNLWFISSPGTLGGKALNVGDSIRALVDNPGQTPGNWDQLESNLGYVPYNATNPAGFTANQSDAYLVERSNHTGTQSADTVDESANRVWVTPALRTAITHANRAALDAVSGVNTGDQTLASLQAQGTASKDASGGYVGLTAYKINFKSADGSQLSYLTNSATASRTYTFPDKNGTVAMTSDITGINSGTNTGDETLGSIQAKLVNTNNLTEGSNNLYYTNARVLAAPLTGYAVAGTNAAVLATDSILVSFGKHQKQINDLQAALTGTSSGTNTGDETKASIESKLSGSLQLSAVSPFVSFSETDQAGAAGKFRVLVDNSQLNVQINTAAAGDYSSYKTPVRVDANARVDLSTGLILSGPAALGSTQNGTFSYEYPNYRFYIGDGTGYAMTWSKRVGNVTTDLVSIWDNGSLVSSIPVLLNGALTLQTSAPVLYYDETDQTGAVGKWRTVADVGEWRLDMNTATARDFSTYTQVMAVTTGGVAKFANTPTVGGTALENTVNKATSFATVNNTLYPTVQAVKAYVDANVAGAVVDCGNWDASTNAFPTTGGTGTSGAIVKGNLFFVSVAGTLGGVAVNVGDSFRALVNAPGQTAANWSVLESNIGYVPANANGSNASGTWAINTTGTVKFTDAANNNASYFIGFGTGVNAQSALNTDLLFSFNPSTDTLSVPNVSSTGNIGTSGTSVSSGQQMSAGSSGSGKGGQYRVIDDTGVNRWWSGIGPTAGGKNWQVNNIVTGRSSINVDNASDIVSLNYGVAAYKTMTMIANPISSARPVTSSVDTTNDIVTTSTNHTFSAGDFVWYTSTGTGLNVAGNSSPSGRGFYVSVPAANQIKLHSTYSDAILGVSALDLVSAGTGTETWSSASRAAVFQTSYTGNSGYLDLFSYRYAAGSDWTAVATRIQMRTDATPQGYLEFNPPSNNYGTLLAATSGIIQLAVNGAVQASIEGAATSVNRVRLKGGAAGAAAVVEAVGPSADADLQVNAQGAGVVRVSSVLSVQAGIQTQQEAFLANTASMTVTLSAKVTPSKKVTVSASCTIATTGWPAAGYMADMMIEMVNGGSAAVTFSGISWILPSTGAPAASFSAYLSAINRSSLQASGTDWIYLWTTNGGTTVNGKLM